MSDGYVQAPADNAGKLVDSDEITNINGTTVERLRVAVPDGMNVSGDVLDAILKEMRLTNDLLAQAFGLGSDVEVLRNIGALSDAS